MRITTGNRSIRTIGPRPNPAPKPIRTDPEEPGPMWTTPAGYPDRTEYARTFYPTDDRNWMYNPR